MQIIDNKRLPTVTDAAICGFFAEYRFLSNYHCAPVELDCLVYPSSEHAYMAQKTCTFKLRAYIASLPSPQEARAFGQTLSLPNSWASQRVPAMQRVLEAKFQRPELRAALKRTGTRYLEETNNWNDTFWGVCEGQGYNQLGLMLMALRNQFANEIGSQLKQGSL